MTESPPQFERRSEGLSLKKKASVLRNLVRRTVDENQMFCHRDRVLVAVSGGADSVALLHLLVQFRETHDLSLSVAHFNHRMRGAESDSDADFVQSLAERFGLPCYIGAAGRSSPRDLSSARSEQEARELRFRFFLDLVKSHGFQKVALGHTLDDQAETVLIRLLRGSGTLGLAGIPATRQGLYVRPLLRARRRDLLDYLRAADLKWREDSSNRTPAYLRNRIRLELIPFLEREFNPAIVETLSQTARLLREDEQFLSQLAEAEFARLARVEGGEIVLDARATVRLHPSLQAQVLRWTYLKVSPGFEMPSAHHLSDFLSLLNPGKSGRQVYDGRVRVYREFDQLRFKLQATSPLPESYDYWLGVPGVVEVVEAGVVYEAALLQDSDPKSGPNRWALWLSAEECREGLKVRNWRPGDRYRPQGSSGVKKVKELFGPHKVPLSLRRTWPVICLGARIILVKAFPRSADMIRREESGKFIGVCVEERPL
ncbi:MAG: tRNA lysidine(34) synthetase TilS [Acidobacteriota bacterium]